MSRIWFVAVGLWGLADVALAADKWQPKPNPLMTKWAEDVDPNNPLPEYPRPQLVREHWQNLNGLWQYAITPKDRETPPEAWDGEILVPFPVESSLSGVQRTVGPDKVLWYRRTLAISQTDAWKNKRILLHFGAVDWETTAWVNGREVGTHRGGYDPFSFDITDALQDETEHELIVRVSDPSDAGFQPRGKQVREPKGIWYTPTTGIWQTVWLEPVAQSHFLAITSHQQPGGIHLRVDAFLDPRTDRLRVEVVEGTKVVGSIQVGGTSVNEPPVLARRWTAQGTVDIPNPKQWSPETPFLYGLRGVIERNGNTLDEVAAYAALREVSIAKDDRGTARIFLNGKPYFQFGPLDQGFWPDGLYTAPTDEALKFDIEMTKKYGFNLIRKHVKVEPARWYYWCDKLGVLVWQDMPSGDRHAPWDPFGKHNGEEITRSEESAANFRTEWKNIIDALRPFPCIVMWVPFNEGWGQFDTVAIAQWTKEYDPTRLVNCASGGNDFPVGDVVDLHRYPGPIAPKPEAHRAAVLGEFGGLGLPLEGHTWLAKGNWGYKSFTSQEMLTEAYLDLIRQLHPMISNDGLSAAIYTQTTDVEIEVNGLMTYDRKVQKLPVDVLANAHRPLWEPRENK
jgi:beta-galactosidase/beta-glucuronidase